VRIDDLGRGRPRQGGGCAAGTDERGRQGSGRPCARTRDAAGDGHCQGGLLGGGRCQGWELLGGGRRRAVGCSGAGAGGQRLLGAGGSSGRVAGRAARLLRGAVGRARRAAAPLGRDGGRGGRRPGWSAAARSGAAGPAAARSRAAGLAAAWSGMGAGLAVGMRDIL
jgi:hypothetical protein